MKRTMQNKLCLTPVVLAVVLWSCGCKKSEPRPEPAQSATGLAPIPTLPLSQALTDKTVKEVSYNPKEALQGLKGVSLTLWGFVDPAARSAGLDPEAWKIELEERLRAAGIPVRPFEEVNQDAEYAYLFLKIDLRPVKGASGFLGAINLSAFQFVYLGRNPAWVVKSEMWATHKPPFWTDEPSVKESAEKLAREVLDIFIQDYLLVNPSSAGR